MALLRLRRALARAQVALYAPDRAAVLLEPVGPRWPEHERADRLRLGAGLAAIANQRLDGRWSDAYRDTLVAVAEAASATTTPIPGDLVPLAPFGVRGVLQVEPWTGSGRTQVVAELAPSAVGPVPVLRKGPPRGGPVTAICALALLVALAVDADDEGRLALALTVEGLVGWYTESHRLTAPRNAVAYAIAHASARLEEAGRSLPADLGD
jgi:hypothetical protein